MANTKAQDTAALIIALKNSTLEGVITLEEHTRYNAMLWEYATLLGIREEVDAIIQAQSAAEFDTVTV